MYHGICFSLHGKNKTCVFLAFFLAISCSYILAFFLAFSWPFHRVPGHFLDFLRHYLINFYFAVSSHFSLPFLPFLRRFFSFPLPFLRPFFALSSPFLRPFFALSSHFLTFFAVSSPLLLLYFSSTSPLLLFYFSSTFSLLLLLAASLSSIGQLTKQIQQQLRAPII